MVSFDVNFVAIVAAAIAQFVVGFLWFGPVFGKTWAKAEGYSSADMKKKKGMTKTMVLHFVTSLLTVFVLANVFKMTGTTGLMNGAYLGFLLALGFGVPVSFGRMLWGKNKSSELFYINAGHQLVSGALIGAVLMLL